MRRWKRRLISQCTMACVALYCWSLAAMLGLADDRSTTRGPNIVVLLADDLGWRDLSCYGSPFCETPSIDSLAQSGMLFTNAYSAASICSPTRASLMTGKHPVRTGITDYIPGLVSKSNQMQTPRTAMQLELGERTMGEIFKTLGYTTFYSGKWHLGPQSHEPDKQGFDLYVSDRDLKNDKRDWTVGQRIVGSFASFLDDHATNPAASAEQKPFLAYLSFHEPHLPILEYPKHIEKYRDKAAALGGTAKPQKERDGLLRVRQDDPAYGSEVAGLDDCVGTVLEALADRKLSDNTIVVFFSDNGGLAMKAKPGPTSNAPLRCGKGWLYEGGIRVPMIVSYPGKITPGKSDQVVVSHDLLPTLIELAGQNETVTDDLRAMDGRSAAPVLLGKQDSLATRAEFWHYPHYHGSTWGPGAAMRDGKWKLVQLDHYRAVELYDLEADIGETVNLADSFPDRVTEMQQELADWQESAGAKFAVPRNLETDQLVAWCIVPFDAAKRGPVERAEMLQELGLKRLAYDWREEHVASWPAEIAALKEHDIELTSFWCSASLEPAGDPGAQRILEFLRKEQVSTQLWVMLPDHELAKISDENERLEAAADAVRQLAIPAGEIGCSVGLYNHGGWIGRPDTLVKVIKKLRAGDSAINQAGIENVGIVYNFHHSHDDLDAFPAALTQMKPYLFCLNLNGTTVGGPKIQTLGNGQLDRKILSWIRQSQYSGPVGILDHRSEMDARDSLKSNIRGLKTLLSPR